MYLSIDLWDKRCWLAVYVEWIVIPKEIVNRVALVDTIKKYIKSYNVETIVVWLPYDLYNKDTKQLNKTKKFISKLENIFPDKKIDSVDERFTSFEADLILSDMWVNNRQWKKDAISASLILESYLKKIKS